MNRLSKSLRNSMKSILVNKFKTNMKSCMKGRKS